MDYKSAAVCEEFEGELLFLLPSSARQGLKIEHDTQYLSLPPLSSPRQIIDHPLLQMPVVHILSVIPRKMILWKLS